jgi:hypothetical protein
VDDEETAWTLEAALMAAVHWREEVVECAVKLGSGEECARV